LALNLLEIYVFFNFRHRNICTAFRIIRTSEPDDFLGPMVNIHRFSTRGAVGSYLGQLSCARNNELPIAGKTFISLFSVFGFAVKIKCAGTANWALDFRAFNYNIQHKRVHRTDDLLSFSKSLSYIVFVSVVLKSR
jgi:hypothetical protein